MTPSRTTPPSKIILRELEAREWTAQDLAGHSDIEQAVCVALLSDLVAVDEAIALGLSEAFDTSAEMWLKLESNYGGDRS